MAELKVVSLERLNLDEHKMRGSRDEVAFGELVESVRRSGVLQPILVRISGEGFVVVAGHRRSEAARQAGLVEIPAYVCDFDEAEASSAAYAENIYRHNLTPIEEAAAVNDLCEHGGYDTEKVAAMLGRSVWWVRDRIAICGWPGDLLQAVNGGFLSVAAASHLAKITDNGHREMLVMYGCENGVTARIAMAWFQSWAAGQAVTHPEETEGAPISTPVAQLPPHTPCVICGVVMEMGKMSYQPVCGGCGVGLIQMAKEKLAAQAAGGGGGVGG